MSVVLEIFTALYYLFLKVLPFAVLFFLIEKINKAEKTTKFFKKDFDVEVFLIIFNKIIEVFLFVFVIGGYYYYILNPYFSYKIFNMADLFSKPVQLILCLVIYDFFSYWRHRLMHRVLWKVHAIHHSASEVTWITRHRFHPFENIISVFFEVTFMYFIGVDPEVIFAGAIILSAVFYLSHANIDLKYPSPFRYLLISPYFHRWHHANIKEAYDKNFCGIFPFWDKLFGTYYHPEELPKGYGLSKQEQSKYSNTYTGSLLYPFLGILKRSYKKTEKENK